MRTGHPGVSAPGSAAEGSLGTEGARVAWHELAVDSVLERLAAEPTGLDPAEAARRLERSGPNELRREEASSWVDLMVRQFRSLIVALLAAAALVSLALGEWIDATAIFAIVILNAILGFTQEYGAQRALAALRSMTSPTARVRRGGRSVRIPARETVVGDLLELEGGDLVAADARLLEASALRTDEATLTGESESVSKTSTRLERPDAPLADRSNMVYLGTSVSAGRGAAVVVATGMSTEFGHIMELLATAEEEERTPLQERLDALGRVLLWSSLALVVLIFGIGLLRGLPTLVLVMTAVSLAVAAVPEGLPAIVTVALALGVQRMAGRRALVRRLHAVETLGATNVICSDKTGTLTVGEMTVRALWVPGREYEVSGEGYAPSGLVTVAGEPPDAAAGSELLRLLRVFVGCNGAELAEESGEWSVVGDPTEGALLSAGLKAGLSAADVELAAPRFAEYPFDSERKRMTVVRAQRSDSDSGSGSGSPSGERLALVKGAPDVLLELCSAVRRGDRVVPLTDDLRQEVLECMGALTERGLRVLAGAERSLGRSGAPGTADGDDASPSAEEVERDLVLVGLVGMADPPRPEAKRAVCMAQQAGIRVVMITGDHPRTAEAIARELGIASVRDEVLTGSEIDAMSDEAFAERIPRVAVFARVTAAHKLRIVHAWKRAGAVVAMTGDGVNDAPAIRGADVGIAMGRKGTEVTKEASDMVVTDDDFASIVAAVEQGRGTYENIRKTIQYLLAGNVGELALMAVAISAGLPLPLMPLQLLWINLFTDGLPALCLAADPLAPDLMTRSPRQRSDSITDRSFVRGIATTGALTASVALAVYLFALDRFPLETARAYAFSTLVFAELLRSFGARSSTIPVWRLGITSNLRLALVVLASIAVQLLLPWTGPLGVALDVPAIPVGHSLALAAAGALPLILLEAAKLLRRVPAPAADPLKR